jgi:hypothetical protein
MEAKCDKSPASTTLAPSQQQHGFEIPNSRNTFIAMLQKRRGNECMKGVVSQSCKDPVDDVDV